MVQLLATLAAAALVLGNSIGLMMLGWGLTPRSWWAIIGFGIVGVVISQTIVSRLSKEIQRELKQ
jgi:hypothetical protein